MFLFLTVALIFLDVTRCRLTNALSQKCFRMSRFSTETIICRHKVELMNILPSFSTNASQLVLEIPKVVRIKKNDFQGLSHLTSLTIKSTGLKTIDDHAFSHLVNLEWLKLENTSISSLNKNLLVGLINLRFFKIIGCTQLQTLHQDIFNDTLSLKRVEIWKTKLETLPTFHNLLHLQSIFVQKNRLKRITKDTFALQSLRTLVLNDNGIEHIEDGSFNNISSLKTLSLKGNKISSIRYDSFSSSINLQYINLEDNQITFIPNATFINLSKLRVLILNRNLIGKINDNTLLGLVSLEILYLNNNHLTSYHEKAFIHTPKIRTLYMADNRLTNLSPFFLSNLFLLRNLFLDNNSLQTPADNTFNSLKELRYLGLKNNRISIINKKTFSGLHQLMKLYLTSNMITSIASTSFKDLYNLQFLYLDDNRLTKLTSRPFSNLNNLIDLNLSNNSLAYIEEGSFVIQTQLLYLILQNNLLTQFGNNLFTRKWTDRQMLEHPERRFEKRVALINLDNNQLSSIPTLKWTIFPKLNNIYLNNNLIENIALEIFSGSSKMTIHLQRNRILCTCKNQKIFNSISHVRFKVDCTMYNETMDIFKFDCSEKNTKWHTIKSQEKRRLDERKKPLITSLPSQFGINLNVSIQPVNDTCNSICFMIGPNFTRDQGYELILTKTNDSVTIKIYFNSKLVLNTDVQTHSSQTLHSLKLLNEERSRLYSSLSVHFDKEPVYEHFYPKRLRRNTTSANMYALIDDTCRNTTQVKHLQASVVSLSQKQGSGIYLKRKFASNSTQQLIQRASLFELVLTLAIHYFVLELM